LSFCETHHLAADQKIGFTVLNPSYELLPLNQFASVRQGAPVQTFDQAIDE
jgi:hypothetical protein